jgi:hypothetical protein
MCMAELLHVPMSPTTIGELVDLADDVPAELVIPLLHEFAEKVRDAADPARRLRDLVVLGALVNRACFEVADLPKDRHHVIA